MGLPKTLYYKAPTRRTSIGLGNDAQILSRKGGGPNVTGRSLAINVTGHLRRFTERTCAQP